MSSLYYQKLRPPHTTTRFAVAQLRDRYCDACVTHHACKFSSRATDSWVHSWGFDMLNLHNWLWTSIAHLLWQNVNCACASRGAQRSACVVCGICSHDCSWDTGSYDHWVMKCPEAFSKILNRCCCAYIQATWYGASHAPVPGGTPRPLGPPAGILLLLGRGRRWRPDPSVVGHGELPRQRRLGVIVDHGFDHRFGTGSVLHGDNGCRFSLQGAESNVRLWHATELCDEKTYMYVKCLIMFHSFTG